MEFEKILSQKPKVLFIFCHGTNGKVTHFCFENEEQPYLEAPCDELRIKSLLNHFDNVLPEVIVLNTCHSY